MVERAFAMRRAFADQLSVSKGGLASLTKINAEYARDARFPNHPFEENMMIGAKQIALGVALAVACGPALAGDAESAFRGKRLAEANCAGCHAIAQFDVGANAQAPAFRRLGHLRSLEDLRRDMQGKLFLRHAVMPDFEPDAGQADDIVTYIESIQD